MRVEIKIFARAKRYERALNRILQKMDREALKQKRSRSEYIELYFETLLFKSFETEKENVSLLAKR